MTLRGLCGIILSLASVVPALALPNPQAALRTLAGPDGIVSVSPATGAVRFVRFERPRLASAAAPVQSPEAQAAAFLAAYGEAFGLTDPARQLRLAGARRDATGATHLAYTQVHHGVPVFAALLRVHFDAAGRMTAVNGTVVPGIGVATDPRLSARDAGRVALGPQGPVAMPHPETPKPISRAVSPGRIVASRLVVFRTGLVRGVPGTSHLAWEIHVQRQFEQDAVYVDAHSGLVLDRIPLSKEALDRRAFDGLGNYPGTPFWEEGQTLPTAPSDAVELIVSTGEVWTFFFTAFGRDSFDGVGGTMDAVFNYESASDCYSAYADYDPPRVRFCDGIPADDFAGHEWMHVYTDRTDALVYQWQPGALNEAYSDIFGETLDLVNGRGVDAPDPVRGTSLCSFFDHHRAIEVEVTSPTAATYPAVMAGSWGEPFDDTGLSGTVVLVDDGAGTSTDGCESPFVNAAAVENNIVLIDRGTCFFAEKAFNAQAAGAKALIVANSAGGGDNLFLFQDTDPDRARSLTIPTAFISYANGTTLKAMLPGATVTISATGPSEESRRWLFGEDSPGWGGFLRDMWNPTCAGDPGKVTDAQYHCDTDDDGGVHHNSGIVNHTYALAVDGGTYNGQTISGIGLTKAAHIYWNAKAYQVPVSDFADHADALETACQDLLGINLNGLTTPGPSGQIVTSGDCAELAKAILATELRTQPVCGFVPQLGQDPPAECPVGPTNTLFSDDFETGLDGWTMANSGDNPTWTPRNWASIELLPYGRSGTGAAAINSSKYDVCSRAGSEEAGRMTMDSPEVVLPSGDYVPKLSFAHSISTDEGWNGGRVRIDVNGGGWQLIGSEAFVYNEYTGVVQGEGAFTGTDERSPQGAWGLSIVDLSSFASPGDTIRVRFEFHAGACFDLPGWFVDDVHIYSCEIAAPVVSSIAPSHGSAFGGTEVTITGTNLDAGDTTVAFGDAQASGVSCSSSTQCVATSPAGIGTVDVRVTNDAGTSADTTADDFTWTAQSCGPIGTAASFPAGSLPTDVAIADFDGDGIRDLAVTDQGAASVLLFRGLGNGAFGAATPFAAGSGAQAVATSDFDGDGEIDLAVANYTAGSVSILLGTGTGSFGATTNFPAGAGPRSIAAADFNGDGRSDLVVAAVDQPAVSVLLGAGDGSFGAPSYFAAGTFPFTAVTGDFNADGASDLAVANQGSNNVSILLGTGTGSFGTATNYATGTTPFSVAADDFDGDGATDLAVTGFASNDVSVLLGTGTGTFGAAAPYPAGSGPFAIASGDIDGDGRLDLAVTNSGAASITILLGTGGGAFGPPSSRSVGTLPHSVTLGDLDGDGRTDLAVANRNSQTVSLLINGGCPPVVTSLSPATGPSAGGTTVVITGWSFVPGATTITFGSAGATAVNCPSTTQCVATSPAGSGTADVRAATSRGTSANTSADDFTFTAVMNTCVVPGAAVAFGTASPPFAIAVGDLNGDGHADLAATDEAANSVSVLLGTGTGTFGAATGYPVGTNPTGVALGDFDGDGDLDLAVANYTSSSVSILPGTGTGTFGGASTFPTGNGPRSITVGDFDGDGDADLALTAVDAHKVSVLLGDGAGAFGPASLFDAGTFPFFLTIGDFDQDGASDLAVANQGSSDVSLLLGTGTGAFGAPVSLAVGGTPFSVAAGDFDGDGLIDLAATSLDDDAVWVLLATGPAEFAPATSVGVGTDPFSLAAADWNGDGNVDLTAGNYGSSDLSILLGNGDGTFQAAVAFGAGSTPRFVTDGDFDEDGRSDFAVASYGPSEVSIILNQTAPGTLALSGGAIAVDEFAGTLTLTVERSAGSDCTVTVAYETSSGSASADDDYTSTTGTVTLGPGVLSETFTVPIVDDALDEDDETFTVTLGSPGGGATLGAQSSATVTITDDDPMPGFVLTRSDSPIAEAGGVASVTATLTTLSGRDVTVALDFLGTATLTDDYTRSSASIVVPKGDLSASIAITAVQDSADEDDETVIADAGSVTNAVENPQQQATVKIADDDADPDDPVLNPIGDRVVSAGSELAFTLTANDPNDDPLTFTVTGLPSGALLDGGSGAFAWTPAAGQIRAWDATFTVTDSDGNSDSESVRITVTSPGAVNAAAVAFDVYNQGRAEALPSHVRAVLSDHASLASHELGTGRDVPVDVTVAPPETCAEPDCTPALAQGALAHYTASLAFPRGGLGRLLISPRPGNQALENEDGTFTLTSSNTTSSAVSFLFGRWFWAEADRARDGEGAKVDESGQLLPQLLSNDAQRAFAAFEAPAFGDLTSLSVTFESLGGGSGNGSPRLEVHLQGGGWIGIRLGDPPFYSDVDATLNAWSGVNLIGNSDAGRFDLSNLAPTGPAHAAYAEALAAAASLTVTRVDFVTESGPSREIRLEAIQLSAETP